VNPRKLAAAAGIIGGIGAVLLAVPSVTAALQPTPDPDIGAGIVGLAGMPMLFAGIVLGGAAFGIRRRKG